MEKIVRALILDAHTSEPIDVTGWQSVEIVRGTCGVILAILRSGEEHAEQFKSGFRVGGGAEVVLSEDGAALVRSDDDACPQS